MNEPTPYDRTTPPADQPLPAPDRPGLWFNQMTQLPVNVIRKEDGELYFQGGEHGEEEMQVSEFARIKANHEQASQYGFVKITPILDGQISLN